ncbi:MAG: IPT/TIG domain-containing protein, partial [Stenotrophomonas maltophilia]
MTVKGQGFERDQIGIPIDFGSNTVASATSDGNGSWTAAFKVPAVAAGKYSINVGGSNTELQLTMAVVPKINLRRHVGSPRELIAISGQGFAAQEREIKVTLAETTVASDITAGSDGSWSASFIVPALPSGSYPVLVSGSVTSRPDLLEETFNIGLHLTLGTTRGIPGTAVGISGRGFGNGEKDITITYDGVTVASGIVADRLGTFSATFIVPPSGAGQHVIKVSSATADKDLASEIGFKVVPGMAVGLTSGPPGTSVDVSGSGFTARSNDLTISYDNTPVLTNVATDAEGGFRVSFIIPPSSAGLHQITVSEPLTTSATSPQRGFRVIPTAALSGPFGYVGMNLDVIGQGFEPATTVTITYDNLTRAAIFTDYAGSFRSTFPIPESRSGEHLVDAYDERGNKIQLRFLVESEPPSAPSLLSPSNGESGGWFGGFRPAPSWSNVDDPSGVTYTLEMATDPHFLNPILIKEG